MVVGTPMHMVLEFLEQKASVLNVVLVCNISQDISS